MHTIVIFNEAEAIAPVRSNHNPCSEIVSLSLVTIKIELGPEKIITNEEYASHIGIAYMKYYTKLTLYVRFNLLPRNAGWLRSSILLFIEKNKTRRCRL